MIVINVNSKLAIMQVYIQLDNMPLIKKNIQLKELTKLIMWLGTQFKLQEI